MTYQIVTRSQHSRGSSRGFGGPDHYMAVLIIPAGATPPQNLRAGSLAKRGIQMHYVGEYYGKSTGPRSNYQKCLEAARAYIARNSEQGYVAI